MRSFTETREEAQVIQRCRNSFPYLGQASDSTTTHSRMKYLRRAHLRQPLQIGRYGDVTCNDSHRGPNFITVPAVIHLQDDFVIITNIGPQNLH